MVWTKISSDQVVLEGLGISLSEFTSDENGVIATIEQDINQERLDREQAILDHKADPDAHPEYVTLTGQETITNKNVSGSVSRMANYVDKTVSLSTNGSVILDLSVADVFNLLLEGPTTISLSNIPPLNGETFAFLISVSQGSVANAFTWFPNITWRTLNGLVPDAPGNNKTKEYLISTTDGVNFIGRVGAFN